MIFGGKLKGNDCLIKSIMTSSETHQSKLDEFTLIPFDADLGEHKSEEEGAWGDDVFSVRPWLLLGLVVSLILAFLSRKEVHDSRLYINGTNAVQITIRSINVFGYEREEVVTNKVEVIRNGESIECVGLTD